MDKVALKLNTAGTWTWSKFWRWIDLSASALSLESELLRSSGHYSLIIARGKYWRMNLQPFVFSCWGFGDKLVSGYVRPSVDTNGRSLSLELHVMQISTISCKSDLGFLQVVCGHGALSYRAQIFRSIQPQVSLLQVYRTFVVWRAFGALSRLQTRSGLPGYRCPLS
jgi:hypothetical protein